MSAASNYDFKPSESDRKNCKEKKPVCNTSAESDDTESLIELSGDDDKDFMSSKSSRRTDKKKKSGSKKSAESDEDQDSEVEVKKKKNVGRPSKRPMNRTPSKAKPRGRPKVSTKRRRSDSEESQEDSDEARSRHRRTSEDTSSRSPSPVPTSSTKDARRGIKVSSNRSRSRSKSDHSSSRSPTPARKMTENDTKQKRPSKGSDSDRSRSVSPAKTPARKSRGRPKNICPHNEKDDKGRDNGTRSLSKHRGHGRPNKKVGGDCTMEDAIEILKEFLQAFTRSQQAFEKDCRQTMKKMQLLIESARTGRTGSDNDSDVSVDKTPPKKSGRPSKQSPSRPGPKSKTHKFEVESSRQQRVVLAKRKSYKDDSSAYEDDSNSSPESGRDRPVKKITRSSRC